MLELVAAYGNHFFHNRPSEVMKKKRTIYRKLAMRFSICYRSRRNTNIGRQNYFFQFSIPIFVHFFNFSLQFFQICFFKIQKKKIALRAMSDLPLNWRASKFHFYLFQNTFTLNFYLFQLSLVYFFTTTFVNFIYSNF